MPAETGVISYPIPPYQNLPIKAEYYEPNRFVISAVTLGKTTTITTTIDHNYVIGQTIRLIIPAKFGCFQLNEVQGYVLSIPATNQVVVSIDSSFNVDNFVSATATTASPQILAIGNVNSGQINNNGVNSNLTYIPGSFRDISPQ